MTLFFVVVIVVAVVVVLVIIVVYVALKMDGYRRTFALSRTDDKLSANNFPCPPAPLLAWPHKVIFDQ